ARLASDVPNINPGTRLSTDYLNHFTEAVMVLEMVSTMPECQSDLRNWRPKTYVEHFMSSGFSRRDRVIADYHAADAKILAALEATSKTINARLVTARDRVLSDLAKADQVARQAVAELKPLMARLADIINGERS